MIAPMNRTAFAAFALLTAAWPATVHAQDVPGIEICTVEKTMERRTSCLQSNVDFLQKTINKLTTDHQQKLDASQPADRGAEERGHWLAEDRQRTAGGAGQGGRREEGASPAAKDAAPAAKDAAPAKEGAK